MDTSENLTRNFNSSIIKLIFSAHQTKKGRKNFINNRRMLSIEGKLEHSSKDVESYYIPPWPYIKRTNEITMNNQFKTDTIIHTMSKNILIMT